MHETGGHFHPAIQPPQLRIVYFPRLRTIKEMSPRFTDLLALRVAALPVA